MLKYYIKNIHYTADTSPTVHLKLHQALEDEVSLVHFGDPPPKDGVSLVHDPDPTFFQSAAAQQRKQLPSQWPV